MWVNNLFWISAVFVIVSCVSVAQSAFIRCYKGSLNNYEEAPLETAKSLMDTTCFNRTLNTVFYTFGFRGKVDGPATTAVLLALFKLKLNILLLNWQREASSIEFLGNPGRMISYATTGLMNTIYVGKKFGQSLERMSENGLDLMKTRLIAHSLGAQLYGYTDRYLKNKGIQVDSIMGLDPAGPFFDQPSVLSSLGRNSGSYILTIITDPGGYGINSSYATANVYVNYGNFIDGSESEQVQPGCPIGEFSMFTNEDLCSHNRVWMLLVDALTRNNDALQASRAQNYYEWEAGNGNSSDIVIIRYDIDKRSRGDYYMSTNSQSPFGRGARGQRP